MISYSVSLSIIILCVIFVVGSVEPLQIMESQRSIGLFYPLFPIAILFLISTIAEVNRAPFDLPEGESSIVQKYMIESNSRDTSRC